MTSNIDMALGRRWSVYSFFLLFQALYSLHPWFLWWLPTKVSVIIFFLVNTYFLLTSYFWSFNDRKRIGAALILVALLQYQSVGSSLNFHVQKLMEAVALLPLIFLMPQFQKNLLEKFQKVMVFILTLSLLFWAGHLIGLDLPSKEMSFGTVERGGVEDFQYHFSNHFFYLENNGWQFRAWAIAPEYMRFSSVFLEPGYLAILMVFFLFVNRFNFREKRNIVYLVTIIASVSLAGFLMGGIAFIASNSQNSKHGLLGVAAMIILLLAGGVFFRNYRGGNNIINTGIIRRIEIDQSTGNMAGYNRTSESFDERFKLFLKSKDVVFGIGREGMDQEFGDAANVGYKVYMMTYGALAMVLFLAFLFFIARMGGNYRSYVLLLLYIIMFMRGHHTMYYFAFMLVYVCGVIESRYRDEDSLYYPYD